MKETFTTMLADLWSDEDGASIVEYVLLIALIAVVCIAAIQILGTSAKNKLEEVGNQINTT